jgi:hypothetical protein
MFGRRDLLPFTVLLLTSTPDGFAQAPPKGEGKRDPQSVIEPRSGPGIGQKFLERFVGDWKVEKSFFRVSGEASTSEGTCRQHMIHGGRFLQSDFTFGTGEEATTGTGIIGFDPATNRFSSTWIDSRSTRFSHRQSKEPFDGKLITLAGAGLSTDATPPRNSRTVSTIEDDGRRIIHRQYGAAADGKERLVMQLLMTRSK